MALTQPDYLPGGEGATFGVIDRFDRELLDVQWAIDTARGNPWFGGDVLAPEFGPVLAAIVAPRRVGYGAGLAPSPGWRGHRNRWREQLDQLG